MNMAKTPGRVVLVGAGPGAADLLTLRAARALSEADLVLYDALVDQSVLDLAPSAQRFYVGKRAGRQNTSQTTIHALMIRAARNGRNVVRLKAGDPFVLGRGGEEVVALEAAGIPVEVVPGISSAIAGPADAGIPVTHRGLSAGLLILSAVPDTHYRIVLAALPPRSVTVVLMMALGARHEIATFLAEVGWPRDLPVAIVLGATTTRAWSWTGMLHELGTAEIPVDRANLPGLIVLGEVVSLSDVVNRARRVESNEEASRWKRQAH